MSRPVRLELIHDITSRDSKHLDGARPREKVRVRKQRQQMSSDSTSFTVFTLVHEARRSLSDKTRHLSAFGAGLSHPPVHACIAAYCSSSALLHRGPPCQSASLGHVNVSRWATSIEETPHFTLPAPSHGKGYSNANLGLIGCPTSAWTDHRALERSCRLHAVCTHSGLLTFPYWTAMHNRVSSMHSCMSTQPYPGRHVTSVFAIFVC
jgi:hypothetical protein